MRVLKIAVATLLLLAVQAPYAVNTAAAGIFTVDSTADTTDANAGDGVCDDGAGNCTLRAAIQEANAFAGTDTIGFNLTSTDPGYVSTTASWRISPGSPLPTTTAPIVIDRYTQPGSAEATSSTVATLKIELDGSGAGSFSIGLAIVGGSTVVKGLVINQFGRAGIRIVGNNGNIVDGNFRELYTLLPKPAIIPM